MNSPVVLITGASRGLGAALALAFAKKKYRVGINYHQNNVEARKTADQVSSAGGQPLLLPGNVAKSNDANECVKKISTEWGRLDVLVNNAGLVKNRTISKMTDEEWRDVMAVNLDGPFYLTRAAIPAMRKQGGGSILNIASYVAPRGVKGAANYAAAKAGLVTLTKNTAIEEGANNIRANAFMPGFHVTDMNRDVWEKFESDIRGQHLLKQLPERDDMAAFAVTIAELKSVSGQVFAFESRLL